ncbi:energy transducer TonB [Nitrospira lenta]|uniref:energy transducer TonB n=1 Tax=Nitrospira lenta TaxID=1436998 RepID=UPI0015E8906F|nr:TonB family protein [Nitrospira lenta]
MNSFFRNAQLSIPAKQGWERRSVGIRLPQHQPYRSAPLADPCGQTSVGSAAGRLILPPMLRGDGDDSEQTALLGWSISALVHGCLLAVAAVVNLHTAQISAIPQKAPFRWDVSLMAAPTNELMAAQSLQPQEVSALAAPDLQPAADARPSPDVSESSDHSEDSRVPESLSSEVAPSPRPPRRPAVSGRSALSAEDTVPAAAMAVANPATALLPPPQVESQRESSSLEVETQLERPNVLQRPQAVTRSTVTRTAFPDYGWLMEELRTRLERVKVYPASAKAAHAQGRVVVQIHVQGDGRLLDPVIEESSGYPILDQAALAALAAASPLRLDHVLGETSVVMLVPLNYQLE